LEKRDKSYHISAWVLLLCLLVSIAALVFYFLENEYSDETLFSILRVIRFSSFILCVLSLYKLITGIYQIIKKPSVLRFLKILLLLILIAYGLSVFFFESFIVVISYGNV